MFVYVDYGRRFNGSGGYRRHSWHSGRHLHARHCVRLQTTVSVYITLFTIQISCVDGLSFIKSWQRLKVFNS